MLDAALSSGTFLFHFRFSALCAEKRKSMIEDAALTFVAKAARGR
jgi:hypothetical protein